MFAALNWSIRGIHGFGNFSGKIYVRREYGKSLTREPIPFYYQQ